VTSLQVKYDAKCVELKDLNATNKRLERQLSLRTNEAEAAVVRGDCLAQAMASLQEEFEAKCVQLKDCSAKYQDSENELKRVRGELAAKREEVQQVNVRLTTWKSHADKREREKKDTIESLKAERKQLQKDQEEERKAMTLANKMLEGKYLGEKRDLAASQVNLTKLQSQFERDSPGGQGRDSRQIRHRGRPGPGSVLYTTHRTKVALSHFESCLAF
jgi:predicted RNase H-like nuclease (RuvC/YqgF family)